MGLPTRAHPPTHLPRLPLLPKLRSRLTPAVAAAVVAALSATAPSARAMPTGAPLWGTTGTGTLPNTETVPTRQVEVGLAYENVSPQAGEDVRFFPIGTATYGLRRGEVGAGYLRERIDDPFLNTTFTTNYSTLHGKYRFYEKPNRRLAAAVGAHYLDFGRVPGNVTSLYAVASRTLTRTGARVSIVGNVGGLYEHITGVNRDNNLRPYASLEAGRNGYSLALDYTPREGQSVKILSLAARYQQERLGLQLGYGQFRGSDEKLFVGASYRFGGKR